MAGRVWVVVGPDYAGKSTLLRILRCRTPWRMVSLDGQFEPEPTGFIHALRGCLRELTATDVRRHGTGADVVAALVEVACLHLRDAAFAADGVTIVDSYFYKLAAKAQLIGLPPARLRSALAEFPEPDGLIAVDTAADVLWRRGSSGGRLHWLEHYGPAPDERSFTLFQHDMMAIVADLVEGLPRFSVNGADEPDRVADDVIRIVTGHVPATRH